VRKYLLLSLCLKHQRTSSKHSVASMKDSPNTDTELKTLSTRCIHSYPTSKLKNLLSFLVRKTVQWYPLKWLHLQRRRVSWHSFRLLAFSFDTNRRESRSCHQYPGLDMKKILNSTKFRSIVFCCCYIARHSAWTRLVLVHRWWSNGNSNLFREFSHNLPLLPGILWEIQPFYPTNQIQQIIVFSSCLKHNNLITFLAAPLLRVGKLLIPLSSLWIPFQNGFYHPLLAGFV